MDVDLSFMVESIFGIEGSTSAQGAGHCRGCCSHLMALQPAHPPARLCVNERTAPCFSPNHGWTGKYVPESLHARVEYLREGENEKVG